MVSVCLPSDALLQHLQSYLGFSYLGHGVSLHSYSRFKARRGSHKEIPFVQGKEQWLHFAGAVMKRYPTSKVSQ